MNQESINNNQLTEFDSILAESISNSKLKEGTIIKGTIAEIEDEAVIVDIGAKVEGRISKREFAFRKDQKELEVGDEIDVYLDKIENHNGDCILSRSKAKSKEIWAEIERSFEAEELVEGVITGKVKPTKGAVSLRGESILGLSEQKISRLGVGRKFQTPRVFNNLSVVRNLEFAAAPNKTPFHLMFETLTSSVKDEVYRIMDYVGLAPYAKVEAGSLSHGQKQWLAISMLVAQAPDVILLDEPVAGLTDDETARTAELIKSLAGDHTVVVIEHDMEFIRDLGAPVTVLHQGQLLTQGMMEEVKADPRVIEVYLGQSDDH